MCVLLYFTIPFSAAALLCFGGLRRMRELCEETNELTNERAARRRVNWRRSRNVSMKIFCGKFMQTLAAQRQRCAVCRRRRCCRVFPIQKNSESNKRLVVVVVVFSVFVVALAASNQNG